MADFGGQSSGSGAESEPLGGASDAPPDGAAASSTQGIVAFPANGFGLGFFVGEVGLRSRQLGFASAAIHGKVIERFEIFGGQFDGLWRAC